MPSRCAASGIYGRWPSGSVSRRSREVDLGRRPVAPAWNRRTAAVAEGLHCGPDAIDAIREQIADQEIRDRPAQLRILANERAEAESSIELANEASHAIDSR